LTISSSPARLSPLHSLHVEAGAVMADVAGWQVVQSYGDVEDEVRVVGESAGVCDITGRLVVRVKSFDLDGVLGALAVGVGSVIRDGDRVIARLTADEALLIGQLGAGGDRQGDVIPNGDPMRYTTDVTSGLTGMRIVGPRARDVIASLSDFDVREEGFSDWSCAQAGFGEVHGTLLRIDIGGAPAYELYVAREFGVYVWEVVVESLGQDGVVAFGNETLARLEQGRVG
jgi:sarcosine oxidase subunit alpha